VAASSGVAICSGTGHAAQAVLFDEPTSPSTRNWSGEVLSTLIGEACEGRMTMIIATHEMGFAREAPTSSSSWTAFCWSRQAHPRELLGQPAAAERQAFLSKVL